MIILSLDQAASTGYCVSKNDKILKYDLIVAKEAENYDLKILDLKQGVVKLIKKYKPDLVTIEGVQFQKFAGVSVYNKLSKLQGVLINYCLEQGIRYEVVPSSTWRSKLGIKGKKREEKKRNAGLFIEKEYGLKILCDDVFEAICMNHFAREHL